MLKINTNSSWQFFRGIMANNDMMSGILKRFDFHHSFVTRAWTMVMFITLIRNLRRDEFFFI
ncbi:hypothetical protein AAX05_01720 [Moraxella bovoculi]|nr:hypothetical protein AAX05_01720 [Moraxella bovoculi]AKG10940.1 hypothetical protein AAX07_01760 [Moraxella bovoculi]AKG12932.1 hypothetical protein AAX11_01475 [Moraxella bovoculi]